MGNVMRNALGVMSKKTNPSTTHASRFTHYASHPQRTLLAASPVVYKEIHAHGCIDLKISIPSFVFFAKPCFLINIS